MNRLLSLALMVLAVSCAYGASIAFLAWRTRRWFR